MSFTAMEREIHKLLRDIPDRNHVADELIKKWHRGVLSPMEAEEVAEFLFRIGMHKSLASELGFQFDKHKHIPVRASLKLFNLYLSEKDLNDEVSRMLYLWAEAENKVADLLRMDRLVSFSKKLTELKDLAIKDSLGFSKRDFEKQKRSIEAHFVNQDWDLAESAIEKMREFYGDNDQLVDYKNRMEFRKALDILQDRPEIKDQAIDFDLVYHEENFDKASVDILIETANKKPSWKYDIAIALYAMSCYPESIAILRSIEEESAKLFLVKVFVESRRYLEALDFLTELLKNSALEEKHGMYLEYSRALCLYEVGKKTSAKETLKRLLKVNPDYRMAGSLLARWEREAQA